MHKTNSRYYIPLIFICLALMSLAARPAYAHSPNVILIMADDMGYESLENGSSVADEVVGELRQNNVALTKVVCGPTRIACLKV